MSRQYWDAKALEDLIEAVGRFLADCGKPPLRELERLSLQLREEHHRNLPMLSTTTLSKVLNHGRKKPPDWRWLACLILCGLRYAAATPGHRSLDEDAVLAEWRQAWLAVHTCEPPAAPTVAHPPVVVPADIAECWEEHVTDLGDLSGAERQAFSRYRTHGLALFRAAQIRGDADAAYRLGVLCWLDGHRPEALTWLTQANDAGHPLARELLDSDITGTCAVNHAAKLGARAAADDDQRAAWLYLKRAAAFSHADAQFHLGEICWERHRLGQALLWFEQAAALGHPLARECLAELRGEAARNGLAPTPASSAVDRWSLRLDEDHPAGA